VVQLGIDTQAAEPEAPVAIEVGLPVPEVSAENVPGETVVLPVSPLEETPPAQESAAAEADYLDFDLGLGTTSGPAVAVAQAAEAAKAPAEEVMILDFDFDLGSPEPSSKEGAADVAVEEAATPADGNAIDFALDAGSPASVEAPAAEASEPAGNEIDFDFDMGTPEPAGLAATSAEVPAADSGATGPGDLDIDFDLSLDEAEAGQAGSESVPVVEGASGGVEAPDLSLELALPSVSERTTATPDSSVLDISLDLDLPQTGETAEIVPAPGIELPAAVSLPAASVEQAAAIELPDLAKNEGGATFAPASSGAATDALVIPDLDLEGDLSAPDQSPAGVSAGAATDDPEVATKLELAQAYEEMGDREGARELLNEVLNEGSAAQQAVARTRLDQLEA